MLPTLPPSSLLTTPWTWRAVLAGIVLTGTFAVGRYTAAKPTVTTKVVERVVTKTVTVQAEAKEVKRLQTIVIYRDRIVKKDGTVETKTESHTTTGSDSKETDTKSIHKNADVDVSSQYSAVYAQPNWHLVALVGSPVSLSPALRFGALVERRVVGPFYLGAWALVGPSGLNPEAGLSIGVSF